MFRDITEHRELNGGEEDRCHSHAQRWHTLSNFEVTWNYWVYK